MGHFAYRGRSIRVCQENNIGRVPGDGAQSVRPHLYRARAARNRLAQARAAALRATCFIGTLVALVLLRTPAAHAADARKKRRAAQAAGDFSNEPA
jgi:hypothetical protein